MKARESGRGHSDRRRVCFVTGSRAEFGLMATALRAIAAHPKLQLQIVATGMHLDPAHGDGLAEVRRAGWTVDRVIPWPAGGADRARFAQAAGTATAGIAAAVEELGSNVVLLVGDRAEAFAAAAAGHLSGCVVAHVHGGDRALGQVDDTLRHAITKLAHIHFPATRESANRIAKLGEDRWRIHHVGSPGVDGIAVAAAPPEELELVGSPGPRRFALLLLHPTSADTAAEYRRAGSLLRAALATGFERVIVVYPNNDPGSAGILRRWDEAATARDPVLRLHRDLPRRTFLGLLRDAAALLGNSSSGIIEAASFGTPVLDVGDRQTGRQRSANVRHVSFEPGAIRRALNAIWNNGRPRQSPGQNVYGGDGAGGRIAAALAALRINERLLRKLICY